MTDWLGWSLAAGVILIIELVSGTFYLLMVGIGLAAGAVASLCGAGLALQAIMAAVVGVIATGALRRSRFGRKARPTAARDPNINLDIGQTIVVQQWCDGTARAMYRGAMWDVDLAPGAQAVAGTFTIREIQGSRLIVSDAQPSAPSI